MPVSRNQETIRVFVSSTSEDLRDYRAVARRAILDTDWKPEMMEHFGAMPEPTVQACYDKLSQCDLMVLIVAFRQGWVPTVQEGGNGTDSITALELKFAQENKIKVLAFLAKDTWPGNLWEDDPEARTWIKNFRNGLNLPVDFFEYESPTVEEEQRFPSFHNKVYNALISYRKSLTPGPRPGPVDLSSASEWLQKGECIPFLGHGVYCEGPLSTCKLREALEDEGCHEPHLATAAEYREGKKGTRYKFLVCLEEIIGEQTEEVRAAATTAVHDLLLRVKRPPLIVSATEDLLLEERLADAGHPPLILCHVIRSAKGAYDGKILVFRGPNDDQPETCDADKIDLRAYREHDGKILGPDDEKPEVTQEVYIIYKPLGSPLLHRQLDDRLEIDTVVMTEADHLVLLRRLENESTGVPTALSRFFRNYPVIFLGYPMDVWQFRLVGQVFQSVGVPSKTSRSIAVRVAASTMEELAWEKLGVGLVEINPNDFAQKITEMLWPH